MTDYFVGVDGGGSKTSAVVVDQHADVLGEGTSGPSNYLRVGMAEATANVGSALDQALSGAGVRSDQILFTYCGIAGSDHPRHREKLVESLRTLFPKGNFTVDTDASVALTAAIGFGSGIVVIAGTGSVAFGRNAAREEVRAGGWGPTIGDEGSAYSIGRRGLSAVARGFDGRGPSTLITELLCNHYEICNPSDLPYFIYAPSTHAADIAVNCRMVIEAARRGDETARNILFEEGEELGITVLAVARRLHMLDTEFPVAWVGGAFHAGDLLIDPMMRVISAEAPKARVQPAAEEPAIGAARMAIVGAFAARPSRKP